MKEIVEKKGINCVKPVIAIVTKENAGFWAEKTNTMSKAELETYVRDYKATLYPPGRIRLNLLMSKWS